MARISEANKIAWFKSKLKESVKKASYKNSCRHDKEDARWLIGCCFNWGLYSLKELVEMRIRVDKEIKKDGEKLLDLVSGYKLMFCMAAFEDYSNMLQHNIFFCDRNNEKIEKEEIQKRCNVLEKFITGFKEYPNLPDELVNLSQEILGKRYTKKFLNRCYRKNN